MKTLTFPRPELSLRVVQAFVTTIVAVPLGVAIAATGSVLIVGALAILAAGATAFAMAGSDEARRSLLISALCVSFVFSGSQRDIGFIVLEPWLLVIPICFVVAAAELAIRRRAIALDRIGLMALLVVITAWLSYFGAIDVMTWFKRAMKITWLFGLYIILASWASDTRYLRSLLSASFWACAAAGLATILQAGWRLAAEDFGEVFGAAGLFANSNEAATYLAIFIVFGLSLYASRVDQRVMSRRSLLMLLGIIALGVLFSRSRTGLISSLAVSSMLFIRTPRVRRLLLVAMGILMLLTLTPATVLVNRLLGSLGMSGDEAFDAFIHGGDIGRLYLVELYWTVIKANPIFGVGAANYGFIGDLGLTYPDPPPGIGIASPDAYLGLSSHNGYINWWVEAGTLGFAAFVASLIIAMTAVWRARRRALSDPDPWWCAMATGTFGGLVVFVLTNFGGEFGVSEIRYWLLLALASISVQQIRARAVSRAGRESLANG